MGRLEVGGERDRGSGKEDAIRAQAARRLDWGVSSEMEEHGDQPFSQGQVESRKCQRAEEVRPGAGASGQGLGSNPSPSSPGHSSMAGP